MAFDLTSCPAGWSEYTPARGRFLRGIDNAAGNDPSGTRPPGNTQGDGLGSHTHDYYVGHTSSGFGHLYSYHQIANADDIGGRYLASAYGGGINIVATGISETRPKNVAVLFCEKN